MKAINFLSYEKILEEIKINNDFIKSLNLEIQKYDAELKQRQLLYISFLTEKIQEDKVFNCQFNILDVHMNSNNTSIEIYLAYDGTHSKLFISSGIFSKGFSKNPRAIISVSINKGMDNFSDYECKRVIKAIYNNLYVSAESKLRSIGLTIDQCKGALLALKQDQANGLKLFLKEIKNMENEYYNEVNKYTDE